MRRINVFINILYYIPSTLHLDNILVKSHEKHPLNWAFSEIRFVVQYCILYLAAAGTVSPFTGRQKYNETPHKRLITAPLPCIVLATHTEIIKYNMWYNINDTCTWIYTNIYTCISTWMYTKWCVHNNTYIDTHKHLCVHSTNHYVHIHIIIMYEYMYKYKVQEEVYIHEHETIHMNTTNEIIYLIHYWAELYILISHVYYL